jgi:hypothetical protein
MCRSGSKVSAAVVAFLLLLDASDATSHDLLLTRDVHVDTERRQLSGAADVTP